MTFDLGAVLAAIVSGGVAGAFVQGISIRHQARQSRSLILGPLREVEEARWSDNGDNDLELRALLKEARSLEAAGVAANMPQEIIETYLAYSVAAFWRSRAYQQFAQSLSGDLDRLPGKYMTDSAVGQAAADMARLVAASAWHPRRAKWFGRRRLREVNALFESTRGRSLEEYIFHPFERHQATVGPLPLPPPPTE